MTHNFSGFSVKVLTDNNGKRWYLFFRANVTDPFLAVSEFEMDRVVKMFESYQVKQKEQMRCRLCNKDANEIGGAILVRVNEKGVPGIWECRPICGAQLDYGERVVAAIDGRFEPPTDGYAEAIDEEDD